MAPAQFEQDSSPARRTYSPAEAAADLARYRKMKRSVSLGSLLVVVLLAAPLVHWSALNATALAVGGFCGVANALLVMAGNERVIERRRVGAFVLSSILRVGLFGIVPVVLAAHGSWWTFGCYFAGFFTPLALYGIVLGRAYKYGRND